MYSFYTIQLLYFGFFKDPKGLAVDQITNRIYIDGEREKIISANIDGAQVVTIAESGPRPLDIIVDPNARLLI